MNRDPSAVNLNLHTMRAYTIHPRLLSLVFSTLHTITIRWAHAKCGPDIDTLFIQIEIYLVGCVRLMCVFALVFGSFFRDFGCVSSIWWINKHAHVLKAKLPTGVRQLANKGKKPHIHGAKRENPTAEHFNRMFSSRNSCFHQNERCQKI